MTAGRVPGGEFVLREGAVAPAVADEFPGLRLVWLAFPGGAGPSPPALRQRLRSLSNRYRGSSVVAMRSRPVPRAYRTFFRQIGLDPDVQRIPAERAAVQRLVDGQFRSVDLISDACLVALIETGIQVWALDGDLVDAESLGIRPAAPEDVAAGAGSDAAGAAVLAPSGALIVADRARPHAVLFADPPPARGVGPHTRRVLLFAVAVDGVPAIHVEEALWTAFDLLGGGQPGW